MVLPIYERKFRNECPTNERRNRSHKITISFHQSKSGLTYLHLCEGRLRYLDGLRSPDPIRSNSEFHIIQQNLRQHIRPWRWPMTKSGRQCLWCSSATRNLPPPSKL